MHILPKLSRKTITAIAVAALLLVAVGFLARHFSNRSAANARDQLLHFVPADATAVIFVDFEPLRSTPFLAQLDAWAPHSPEDSEYLQFVRDTGFNYQRDLWKAFVAFSHHGTSSRSLILADGNFDRKKIETYLSRTGKVVQQGNLKIYELPADETGKALSVALVTDSRIAISDAPDLSTTLSSAIRDSHRAEWQTRFDRLAGSPAFAVIRQDPVLAQAFAASAPGVHSPKLAMVLDQMQWITLAARPDGEMLRLVAEGECSSSATRSHASDFLQGLVLLAQTGLDDPKLRQQMNPDVRDAYVELLKSVDIQNLDRGDSKSVRLSLAITPRFLSLAKTPSSAPSVRENFDPPGKSAPAKALPRKSAKHSPPQ